MINAKRQENNIADRAKLNEIRLRVLATSDLHMQMVAFDYVKDCPNRDGSLAKLATLIKSERAQAARAGTACLLFDNGDTFQGTPLADLLAHKNSEDPHPMVACMKALNFQAGGLGNHDFDHGIDRLASYLKQHEMPVVCSNLTTAALPMIRKSHIVTVPVRAEDPNGEVLHIGVLSTLPDKTALWNRHHVAERAEFSPPLPVLRKEARSLKAAGADVVIVLAHMGLALFDEGKDPQNQISDVAALDDIDVVIGGHTHLRFPGPDHQVLSEADCAKGTVHGKPVVQPGASASDLGVINLKLERSNSASPWTITDAVVTLRHTDKETVEDPEILDIVSSVHAETRAYLAQPVATLPKPVNTFFALAQPSPLPALLAAAKKWLVAEAVKGSVHADLPLVAVASAPLTGGFDGPDNFLNLSKGQINRQHVAGMNPYANHVWAVRTTGAQLLDWLERSVLIFNTLCSDNPDQLLVNPQVPGFRYDAIYGLRYKIDPRNMPLFDPSGKRSPEANGRIQDVQWMGKPLDKEQEFLVATTDHRAGGGGLYKTFGDSEIVIHGHAPLQDAVMEFLMSPENVATETECPWEFVPDMNVSAIMLSAPGAIDYLDEISALKPTPCGETEDGFLRLRVHL
ncbi:MAG: 5'-nucleotidase C-terminal domain-containing protein [Roseobacter sp.]